MARSIYIASFKAQDVGIRKNAPASKVKLVGHVDHLDEPLIRSKLIREYGVAPEKVEVRTTGILDHLADEFVDDAAGMLAHQGCRVMNNLTHK